MVAAARRGMRTGTGAITHMTDPTALQTLLAWFSPAFPVGSYSYSHGLEQAIADGEITDAASAGAWIADVIAHGAGRNDAILLALAYSGQDVADLAAALAGSAERHHETAAQGAAFARIVSAIHAPLAAAPYPVAVGRAARVANLPLPATLTAFLQGFAANLIAACVRFVPLGQTEGQALLAHLMPLIARIATEAATADESDLGGACLRGDLAAIRHETLDTRIFRT